MARGKLAYNIAAFVAVLGKTQDEVASGIGISTGYLNKLMSGESHNPSAEIIEKLTRYFGISEEALRHKDFTSIKGINDIDAYDKNINIILPIFSTAALLEENEDFKRAYVAHRRIYELSAQLKLASNKDEVMALFNTCADFYIELIKADEIPKEYIANMMAHIFYVLQLREYVDLIEQFQNDFERYPMMVQIALERKSETRNRINALLDSGWSGTQCTESIEELRNDSDIRSWFYEMLSKLKRCAQWSDLADYYICLLYVFNITSNAFSNEQNKEFGFDLMEKYAVLGNGYAQNYINIMRAFEHC